MTSKNREVILNSIRANIVNEGKHVYSIIGGASPRFIYTIGLSNSCKYELIIAGSSYYSTNEAKDIINLIDAELQLGTDWRTVRMFSAKYGSFSLKEVDTSWVEKMLLGAIDYYNSKNIMALQIIPDEKHWTIDIPNLSKPWSASNEPIWQWLDSKWPFTVPENSIAITNLNALKGNLITEVMRWQDGEWEIFSGSGPDTPENDIREVPLGTILASDQSLLKAVELKIGKGFWRNESDLEWNSWG